LAVAVGRRLEATIALHDPPAVVAATGHNVDFLDCALPDIPRIKLTCLPIEGEPPWIAEAKCIDLASAAGARERVVGRDRVWLTIVDIDAEDLAKQLLSVLSRFPGSPAEPPSPRPMYR